MTFGENGTKRAMKHGQVFILMAAMALVSGCDEGNKLGFFQPKAGAGQAAPSKSVKLVDRDVEAPDVFQATESGLWDGRPSLGGVWVAHPDVKDPERVIIRNTTNGKFVIGALFRRERENPGPKFQISSDAADTLGMLAGAPALLNVTALRREEQAPAAAEADAVDTTLSAPDAVQETSLDPITSAAAAIDAAETDTKTASPAPTGPAPAAKPATNLDKPYIQIGIFSVEANANNTATAMRTAGIVPTVKKQTSSGKTFWRVLVGPATTNAERSDLLKKVKASGFNDAYAVSN